MDNERIRAFCLSLPHVTETVNWGHALCFFVGDKAIGGKMFAIVDLEGTGKGVLSLHAGAERFAELAEMEGVIPAPYIARAYWVMLERWDALRPREIEEELRLAYALVYARLPKRTQTVLAMPEKERARLIRERKKLLAAREKQAKEK